MHYFPDRDFAWGHIRWDEYCIKRYYATVIGYNQFQSKQCACGISCSMHRKLCSAATFTKFLDYPNTTNNTSYKNTETCYLKVHGGLEAIHSDADGFPQRGRGRHDTGSVCQQNRKKTTVATRVTQTDQQLIWSSLKTSQPEMPSTSQG